MRSLLGVLSLGALGGLLLATPRAPAETQQTTQPSPSPKAPKASPSPKKAYTDEDLARYKAMRGSPSPTPEDSAPTTEPAPRLPPLSGTAATGTKVTPYRRPGAPPLPPPPQDPGSGVSSRPSPEAPPSAEQVAEKEWRQRGRAANSAVTSARAHVAQAESQANALFAQQLQSTDTNEIMRLRQEVADATERVDAAKKAVTDAEAALARLEEEARQAGIPPGYLRDDAR